jgi:uncharacterized membrane protein YeaQ/YmgE (transglycosylase-associated protein family)
LVTVGAVSYCGVGSLGTPSSQKPIKPVPAGGSHRREHDMGIIAWIVLGLIVGAIAKMIMPGRDGGGIILTTVLGVVGAFVGGIIGKYVFHTALGGFFNLRTWLLAILGSVIVLGIYHLVTRRSSVTR